MTTKNAIITLIKKRNESYGSKNLDWNYSAPSYNSWSSYEILNIKGFNVAKDMSGMAALIEPMIARVEIINDQEVNLVIVRK